MKRLIKKVTIYFEQKYNLKIDTICEGYSTTGSAYKTIVFCDENCKSYEYLIDKFTFEIIELQNEF
jgi:hypothetical protein